MVITASVKVRKKLSPHRDLNTTGHWPNIRSWVPFQNCSRDVALLQVDSRDPGRWKEASTRQSPALSPPPYSPFQDRVRMDIQHSWKRQNRFPNMRLLVDKWLACLQNSLTTNYILLCLLKKNSSSHFNHSLWENQTAVYRKCIEKRLWDDSSHIKDYLRVALKKKGKKEMKPSKNIRNR